MFRFRKMSKQKRKKYLVSTSVSFLLLVLLFLLMAAWSNYTVTVDDNGNAVTLKTKQSTVGEVLAEAGITLGDFDKVEPAKGETVYNNMNIVISRAVLLSVTDGGTSIEYYSTAKTVEVPKVCRSFSLRTDFPLQNQLFVPKAFCSGQALLWTMRFFRK